MIINQYVPPNELVDGPASTSNIVSVALFSVSSENKITQ